MDSLKPNDLITKTWFSHIQRWNEGNYFDAIANITPDVAGAKQACVWEITVETGEACLEVGDHIAIEFSAGWKLDNARPLVHGTNVFQDQQVTGRGATVKFEFKDEVKVESMYSSNRYNYSHVIDTVICSGTVPPNSTFKIWPADPIGTLLRCPWFAQDAIINIAVLKKGSDLYRRLKQIPVLHVKGGMPRLWKSSVTIDPSHDLASIKVIAADIENLNPTDYDKKPNPLPEYADDFLELKKQDGYKGACIWKGKIKVKDQVEPYRFEFLNRESGLYGRSNPIAPSLYDGMQVYFGDLHGQCYKSYGIGTEEEYFAWAKDGELLDFVAPANHYGGRVIFDHIHRKDLIEVCDQFYDPGNFVTFYSYEWNGHQYGHRNVYYSETPGEFYLSSDERADSIDKLHDTLGKQGIKVMTIPHHVNKFKDGSWARHNPQLERVVEVCSLWGDSETRGDQCVQAALKRGYRLGVVGGTDTHMSQAGRSPLGIYDPAGLSVIISDKLDRESLWESLYNRRCYATTGEKIILDFRVNDKMMGSELPYSGKCTISGRVIGTNPLQTVEVVRNNEVIKRFEYINSETLEFSFDDQDDFLEIALTPEIDLKEKFVFYYLRVTQKDYHWAMSSPVWILENGV